MGEELGSRFEWDAKNVETNKSREWRFHRPRVRLYARLRGKYASRFPIGSKIVVIAPDVAREFATPQGVNDALRRLAKAEQQVLAVKRELRELKKSLRTTRVAPKVTKRAKHPAQGKGNRG